MEIHFQKQWASGCFEVYAFRQNSQGERIPYRLSFEELLPVPNHSRMEPTAMIRVEIAQQFFAALIKGLEEAEIMPRGTELAGELKASKLHLEDMRRIALYGKPGHVVEK